MVLHSHLVRDTSYTQMGSGQVQCPHLAPLPKELALLKGMLYTLLALHFGQHYHRTKVVTTVL